MGIKLKGTIPSHEPEMELQLPVGPD